MDILVPDEEREAIAQKLAELELSESQKPAGLSRTFSIPGRGTKDQAPGFDGDRFTRHGDSDPSCRPSSLDKAREKFGKDAMILAHQVCMQNGKVDGGAIVEQMTHHTYGLRGCVFVGHTNTDMDSIGSAIGASELYGGIPARAEESLNGEIEFALQYSGLPTPEYFDKVPGAVASLPDTPGVGIVLVDHNEPKQSPLAFMSQKLPDSVRKHNVARIRGVIDHHAISEGFSSAGPLFMDIRPWGSACSIICSNYIRKGTPIAEGIAKILLCGILSDTLNLTSPTTTDADRLMTVLLTILADVERPVNCAGIGEHPRASVVAGPNQLAAAMFKAKTNWFVGLGAYAICRGDKKEFDLGDKGNGQPWRFAWGTVEVTDARPFMAIADELLLELRLMKKEDPENRENELEDVSKHLDFAFLSIVDIVNQQTKLLICGGRELKLAQTIWPDCQLESAIPEAESMGDVKSGWKSSWSESFPSKYLKIEQTCMDLGNRVSRKKQFLPPLKDALNAGFVLDEDQALAAMNECAPCVETTHVCNEDGCRVHRHYQPAWFLPGGAAAEK